MFGESLDVKRIAPTHGIRRHQDDSSPVLLQTSGNDDEITTKLGSREPGLGFSLIHVDPGVVDAELHHHEVRMMTAYVTIQTGHGLPGGGVADAGVNDDRANTLRGKCSGQTVRIDLLDLGRPVPCGCCRGITEGYNANRVTRRGQRSTAPELSGVMREGA
jgi:hypothetical protein